MRFAFRSAVAATSLSLTALLAGPAAAQERYSPFVPSEQANVDRMLQLANIRDGDVIVDLGSGDGRIVLTAARANPTVRGIGVDLDEKLVEKSNAAAKAEGLADRVKFLHQNAFDADLSQVTIIAMWLWPEVQHMLRPKIFKEARPGTRVITNLFEIGNWAPDQMDKDGPQVNLWFVPARVDGYWSWELATESGKRAYAAIFEQRLQIIEGFLRVGERRALLSDVKLRGEEISFTVSLTLERSGFTRHEFTGRVRGDTIEGVAKISWPKPDDESEMESKVLPWRATRTQTSAYFAPTGLGAK
jgi:SAM-dependent methyltransferase